MENEELLAFVDDPASEEEWSKPLPEKSRWQQFIEKITPSEPCEPTVDQPLCPNIGTFTRKLSQHPYHCPFVVAFLIFSSVALFGLFWMNAFSATTPQGPAQYIGCGESFWSYDNCGVNGTDCLPYESDWMPMRCDALCSSYKIYHSIGTKYYRADSYICTAATHAGVIGPMGGCFLVRLTGPQPRFNESNSGGVFSLDWPTYFPKSFEVKECSSTFCIPLQWVILPTYIIFGFILLLLRVPKWTFFLFLIHVGWWYIAFSGTKDTPHGDDWTNMVFATMLPSFAFTFVLFQIGNKAILGPDFPIDNLIFYLIPCIILIHMNYLTFILDFDLTPSSLSKIQTPAIICIALIGVVAFGIAIPQVYFLWKSGKLFKFLFYYFLLIVTIVLIAVALRSRFEFHLHHYMIALALWPVTAMNTRSSALLQAILLGIFINGAARWGFGSLFDPVQIPKPEPPLLWLQSQTPTNATLAWENSCQSYSLRMNDFEVYRGIVPEATIEFPIQGLGLFYHFCVRCIQEGVLGSHCSNYVSIGSSQFSV